MGTAVFARVRGPCPALGYDDDGKSFCGLIAAPEKFSPIDAAIHGRSALSEGAVILVGAGMGCDALRDGEERPAGTHDAMMAKARLLPRAMVAKAMRAWNMRR